MTKELHAFDYDSAGAAHIITGVGDLTEGRTSTIYLPDDAGIWQAFTSGIAGKIYAAAKWWLYGSSATTNMVTESHDLTQAVWDETGGAQNDIVVNGDFATDTVWTKNDGWTIAAGVATSDGAGGGNQYLRQLSLLTVGVRYKITYTVLNYVTGTVVMRAGDISGPSRTANGTYTDYLVADNTSLQFRSASGTFEGDIDDVIVTEAIANHNAVGMRGDADGATTLNDDDTSTLEFVEEIVTGITADSDTHTARFFLHKTEGSATHPAFTFTLQNGGGSIRISVAKSDAAVNQDLDAGTNSYEINSAGDWWEILLQVENAGTAVQAQLNIFPAYGATQSTSDVGDVVIGNVELHLSKTIAHVRGTSPIFTDGSTVTVNATNLSIDDANHNDLEGAYYVEVMDAGLSVASGLMGVGTAGRMFHLGTSTFRTYDGVVDSTANVTAFASDDTEYKAALAYGGILKRVNGDDAWGTEGAYDGEFNNTLDKINIIASTNTTGLPLGTVYMRNLRRYDMTYDEAIIAIPLMMDGEFPPESKSNFLAVTRRTASQMRPKQRMQQPRATTRGFFGD